MLMNLFEKFAFLCFIVLIIVVGYLGYKYQYTKQTLDKTFMEYKIVEREGNILTIRTNHYMYEVTIANDEVNGDRVKALQTKMITFLL